MCGRVVQSSPVEIVRAEFRARLAEPIETPPRFNVAPEQPVLAVTATEAERTLRWLRWGLVPFFAKERKSGPRAINVRAETVATKPAFRELLARRRCVIPADGFYEWHGEGPARTPHFVHARDRALLPLAGLWDRWRRPDEPVIETFTLLTCEPNAVVAEIHDRMPVILASDAVDRWLDPTIAEPAALVPLLHPSPPDDLECWPVSRAVNAARNQGADLIARVRPMSIRPEQAWLPFDSPKRR